MKTVLIHPLLGAALGLWHGPRRHPRHAPAGARGAARRGRARRSVPRGRPARRRLQHGGRRPGRARRRGRHRTCGLTCATPARTPRSRCPVDPSLAGDERTSAARCERRARFPSAHTARASASSTRARRSSSRPSRVEGCRRRRRDRMKSVHADAPSGAACSPPSRPASFRRARWHDAAVFTREQLAPGHAVRGPALVIEPHQTIVVETAGRPRSPPRTTSC